MTRSKATKDHDGLVGQGHQRHLDEFINLESRLRFSPKFMRLPYEPDEMGVWEPLI